MYSLSHISLYHEAIGFETATREPVPNLVTGDGQRKLWGFRKQASNKTPCPVILTITQILIIQILLLKHWTFVNYST